jgi:SAM-dependent methyltransferase
VKAGETLIDVGCFIGHDLRRLVYDGAPSTNLYGIDIVSYSNVGYEMFRDKDHFDAHFIEADILSESDPALSLLKGKVDIVSATHVLHSWDWDGQIKAAKALATFTKPGSMIVGSQVGNHKAHEVTVKPLPAQWRQNPESIEKFWNQVGSETGTKWEARAWIRSFEEMGWHSEDHAWMEDGLANVEFVVKRMQ